MVLWYPCRMAIKINIDPSLRQWRSRESRHRPGVWNVCLEVRALSLANFCRWAGLTTDIGRWDLRGAMGGSKVFKTTKRIWSLLFSVSYVVDCQLIHWRRFSLKDISLVTRDSSYE